VDDVAGSGFGPWSTEEEKAAFGRRMARHAEAGRTHDALCRAVGQCMHEALAVPQRAARDQRDPARRAERQHAIQGEAKAVAAAAAGAAADGAGVGPGRNRSKIFYTLMS